MLYMYILYIVVFGSVFSLFCWRFAGGSWSWWCDASRGIGRCGAVFFHYATGVDLEFTLRSADVVEKQDGLDQKLYRCKGIYSKGLGYYLFFLSPLDWATLEFICHFFWGFWFWCRTCVFFWSVPSPRGCFWHESSRWCEFHRSQEVEFVGLGMITALNSDLALSRFSDVEDQWEIVNWHALNLSLTQQTAFEDDFEVKMKFKWVSYIGIFCFWTWFHGARTSKRSSPLPMHFTFPWRQCLCCSSDGFRCLLLACKEPVIWFPEFSCLFPALGF